MNANIKYCNFFCYHFVFQDNFRFMWKLNLWPAWGTLFSLSLSLSLSLPLGKNIYTLSQLVYNFVMPPRVLNFCFSLSLPDEGFHSNISVRKELNVTRFFSLPLSHLTNNKLTIFSKESPSNGARISQTGNSIFSRFLTRTRKKREFNWPWKVAGEKERKKNTNIFVFSFKTFKPKKRKLYLNDLSTTKRQFLNVLAISSLFSKALKNAKKLLALLCLLLFVVMFAKVKCLWPL